MNLIIIHKTFAVGTLDPKTTPQGTPLNFCNTNAQETIKNLNKKTDEKLKEIKDLQKNMNALIAKKTLIEGFLKLKDDYLSAHKAFTEAVNSQDMGKKVSDFRALINTSLTMSLVHTFAKNKNAENINPTLDNICSDPKNKESHFCDYLKNSEGTEGKKRLQTVLDDVNTALRKDSDPEKTKESIEAIYDSIPSEMSPSRLLQDLKNASTDNELKNNPDREAINECLESFWSDVDCKNIMLDKKKKESLEKILFSQMNNVQKKIAQRKFTELSDRYDRFDPEAEKTRLDFLRKSIAMADYDLNKISSLNEAELNEFKENCNNPNPALSVRELCKEYSEKIVEKIKKEDEENSKKLTESQEKLDKLLSPSGELQALERIKHYVQNKYIRTCGSSVDQNKELMASSICNFSNVPTDPINNLNKNVSNVIGNLKSYSFTKESAELGPFSKAELEDYKNECQNNNISNIESVQVVCRDIFSESNKIANMKEAKEWDDFNNKYWVKYSDKNAKGYEVFEKKSELRIFGEGIRQSVGQILPMWLGNMQLSNQIDMMTNQALYMKQMNYMYNPTSPWMINNPYFQGSYFNTNAAFTGFGESTIPNTTPSADGGFNFGN